MVVINPFNGHIMTAKIFDTYESSDEFDDFLRNGVPEGCIIIAACKDECTRHLSFRAKQWFEDMGSKEIWNLEYRHGFAFIGIHGKNDVHEKVAKSKKHQVRVTKRF